MKPNPHEDLVAYLFGESEEPDRRRIEQHLQETDADRDTLEQWQETRRLLDAWKINTPAKRHRPRFVVPPLLKLAASIVFLLGIGFMLGRVPMTNSPDREAWRKEIQAEIAQRLATEREEWEKEQRTLQAQMLRAAGHETHASASGFAQKTIESLRSSDMRNATLALLLPAEEQAKYFAQRERLERVATATDREVQRTRENIYQIIARATPTGGNH